MNISDVCCSGSLVSIIGASVGALTCFSMAKEPSRIVKHREITQSAENGSVIERVNERVSEEAELAARKVQRIPPKHATFGAIIGYLGGALGSYAGGLLTGTIPGMIFGGLVGSTISAALLVRQFYFANSIALLDKNTAKDRKTVNPKSFCPGSGHTNSKKAEKEGNVNGEKEGVNTADHRERQCGANASIIKISVFKPAPPDQAVV
ncbi:MAG: VTT domain-containing protein [Puniceicoccales bacterium]|jgi:predicted lipid-binding transport protein (Tim44 family)|nr:VTT domain-containing protein [Puniceicoccales bacterium]